MQFPNESQLEQGEMFHKHAHTLQGTEGMRTPLVLLEGIVY